MFGPGYFGTSYFGPTYFPPGVVEEQPTGSAGGRSRTLSLPVSPPKISKRVDSTLEDIDAFEVKDFEEDKKQLEALLDKADKIDAFEKAELRAKARALEDAQIKEKILRALEAEFLEKERIKKLRLEEEEILLLLMMLSDE